MMILKTMGGEEFSIQDQEVALIMSAKEQFVAIRSIGVIINKNSISAIYPEGADRREQKTGVLRDGSRVRKEFGEWIMARRGSNGEKIYPNQEYYPELKLDRVATEAQFQRVLDGEADYNEAVGIDKGKMKAFVIK